MTRRSASALSLAACAVLALPFALRAQQGATQSAPTYTAAQAAAGKTAYDASCASCHGGSLDDGALAPALKGVGFVQKYGGKSVEALFAKVASMPPASPNSLGVETTARITAYLLQANAIVAGTSELPSDGAALARMTIPVGGFSVTAYSPYAPALPAVTRPNPLDGFTPISDAQLVEPAAQDWLTWRRSYDAHGFSPLSQITARNVGGLRVAWSWTLPAGSSESTPLVHDGVMFVQGSNDRVQALDARTGDLLWQYERRLPQGVAGSFKRGLALHGNRLYMATSDVHVIALDAKTGSLVWEQAVGDPKVREQIGGGPLVARGKVMIGTVGTGVGAKPGGPEIVGLDAETGRIAWRVHTIAQPGTPGGDSWNGMPLQQRSGASVWTPGSYDPGTGLAYFGTGNTYDTGPLVKPNGTPGVTNDALYTDSTLAIDPDTGTLVWHFQHHPNDQWDLDWAFERQLIRLPVNGETRTVTLTAGKIGIYDALDAKSGQDPLFHRPRVEQPRHRDRSEDRRQDHEAEPGAGRRPGEDGVPARGGRQELAARLVHAGDQDPVRADRRGVHGSLPRARRRARRALDGREPRRAAAARQRRQLRAAPGDQSRDPQDDVDHASPRAESPPARWPLPAAWCSRARSIARCAPTTRRAARCCGRRGSTTCRARCRSRTR